MKSFDKFITEKLSTNATFSTVAASAKISGIGTSSSAGVGSNDIIFKPGNQKPVKPERGSIGFGFKLPIAVFNGVVSSLKKSNVVFDEDDPKSITQALNVLRQNERKELVKDVAKESGTEVDFETLLSDFQDVLDSLDTATKEFSRYADAQAEVINSNREKLLGDIWNSDKYTADQANDQLAIWTKQNMGTDVGIRPGTDRPTLEKPDPDPNSGSVKPIPVDGRPVDPTLVQQPFDFGPGGVQQWVSDWFTSTFWLPADPPGSGPPTYLHPTYGEIVTAYMNNWGQPGFDGQSLAAMLAANWDPSGLMQSVTAPDGSGSTPTPQQANNVPTPFMGNRSDAFQQRTGDDPITLPDDPPGFPPIYRGTPDNPNFGKPTKPPVKFDVLPKPSWQDLITPPPVDDPITDPPEPPEDDDPLDLPDDDPDFTPQQNFQYQQWLDNQEKERKERENRPGGYPHELTPPGQNPIDPSGIPVPGYGIPGEYVPGNQTKPQLQSKPKDEITPNQYYDPYYDPYEDDYPAPPHQGLPKPEPPKPEPPKLFPAGPWLNPMFGQKNLQPGQKPFDLTNPFGKPETSPKPEKGDPNWPGDTWPNFLRKPSDFNQETDPEPEDPNPFRPGFLRGPRVPRRELIGKPKPTQSDDPHEPNYIPPKSGQGEPPFDQGPGFVGPERYLSPEVKPQDPVRDVYPGPLYPGEDPFNPDGGAGEDSIDPPEPPIDVRPTQSPKPGFMLPDWLRNLQKNLPGDANVPAGKRLNWRFDKNNPLNPGQPIKDKLPHDFVIPGQEPDPPGTPSFEDLLDTKPEREKYPPGTDPSDQVTPPEGVPAIDPPSYQVAPPGYRRPQVNPNSPLLPYPGLPYIPKPPQINPDNFPTPFPGPGRLIKPIKQLLPQLTRPLFGYQAKSGQDEPFDPDGGGKDKPKPQTTPLNPLGIPTVPKTPDLDRDGVPDDGGWVKNSNPPPYWRWIPKTRVGAPGLGIRPINRPGLNQQVPGRNYPDSIRDYPDNVPTLTPTRGTVPDNWVDPDGDGVYTPRPEVRPYDPYGSNPFDATASTQRRSTMVPPDMDIPRPPAGTPVAPFPLNNPLEPDFYHDDGSFDFIDDYYYDGPYKPAVLNPVPVRKPRPRLNPIDPQNPNTGPFDSGPRLQPGPAIAQPSRVDPTDPTNPMNPTTPITPDTDPNDIDLEMGPRLQPWQPGFTYPEVRPYDRYRPTPVDPTSQRSGQSDGGVMSPKPGTLDTRPNWMKDLPSWARPPKPQLTPAPTRPGSVDPNKPRPTFNTDPFEDLPTNPNNGLPTRPDGSPIVPDPVPVTPPTIRPLDYQAPDEVPTRPDGSPIVPKPVRIKPTNIPLLPGDGSVTYRGGGGPGEDPFDPDGGADPQPGDPYTNDPQVTPYLPHRGVPAGWDGRHSIQPWTPQTPDGIPVNPYFYNPTVTPLAPNDIERPQFGDPHFDFWRDFMGPTVVDPTVRGFDKVKDRVRQTVDTIFPPNRAPFPKPPPRPPVRFNTPSGAPNDIDNDGVPDFSIDPFSPDGRGNWQYSPDDDVYYHPDDYEEVTPPGPPGRSGQLDPEGDGVMGGSSVGGPTPTLQRYTPPLDDYSQYTGDRKPPVDTTPDEEEDNIPFWRKRNGSSFVGKRTKSKRLKIKQPR